MLSHPGLDRLDAALAAVVSSAPVGVLGEWVTCTRRSYQMGTQLGSGTGPYVDVVDHVWEGRLTAPFPFTGIAFFQSEVEVHWAKAAHASQELAVRVSLTGYADYRLDRMTFAAGLDDAYPLATSVSATLGRLSECIVATDAVPSGRVACVARTDGKAFFVVLFASELVKFRRNRLWRLRDEYASQLPSDLAELLTRRRTGVLRE